MGLKQSVVIVNEFTVPLPSSNKSGGKQGSRGGTPGDYVTRYMAREMATESLAPIRRHRTDDFIVRYMARENATEKMDMPSAGALKGEMAKAQGEGGVAFGYGHVSLSHDQLKASAKDVQALFDEGHTVLKTVLSFDHEYLKKHGIIPEDFEIERKGDYRGHVDQMKLRLAIMNGLDKMGRVSYDELRYVGVIQVDTEHVHCHLAMVDAGPGRLAKDGTQKGKIDERSKLLLRRGVDDWLDEKQSVRHLTSAVGYERRNVITFVKRWAHQQMLRESLPQFLLATLPEDRRLWRSGTNHEAMRKPNRIVHQIVEEVLDKEGSPMSDAMASVQQYADTRREREDLSADQWRRLVERGREQIVERGVNAVYSLLRQLPEDALRIRTPMLDAMGMDYEELAQRAHSGEEGRDEAEDIVGFGFRLRSFSSRLEHHVGQRERYHGLARDWEEANEQGQASATSRALYEFYEEEEDYHARCASKYRHFLSFTPPTATWTEDWKGVAEYGERLISLESMRRDQSIRKTKDEDEAEQLGMDIYGQRGGRLVARGGEAAAATLAERVRRMRDAYAKKVEDLRVKLAGWGLRMRVRTDPATGEDTPVVEAGAEHPFEDVKGMDLHHMRYDFSQDVEVGKRTLGLFRDKAARRADKLASAIEYLDSTDQGSTAADLPIQDVIAMKKLGDAIEEDPDSMLPSHVAELARERELLRRSRTVRLGQGLSRRIENDVEAVSRLPFDPEVEAAGIEAELERSAREEGLT